MDTLINKEPLLQHFTLTPVGGEALSINAPLQTVLPFQLSCFATFQVMNYRIITVKCCRYHSNCNERWQMGWVMVVWQEVNFLQRIHMNPCHWAKFSWWH